MYYVPASFLVIIAGLVNVSVPTKISDRDVFNHYHYLGCPIEPCWPRGFPVTKMKHVDNVSTNMEGFSIKGSEIGVLQSLADHQPDVDAVFELSRKERHFSFNSVSMKTKDKIIILPEGVFSPLNSMVINF